MSTQIASLSELELLQLFIEKRLAAGDRKTPIDECLAEFRLWREDLERVREEIRPALESSLRGETRPFDLEALKARVTRELADRGITD
jgi:hypothetical protein